MNGIPRRILRHVTFSRTLLAALIAAAFLPASAGAGEAAAVFYYPWYGTEAEDGAYLHWGQNGVPAPFDIASNFFPARGAYSSGDPRVLDGQMREIAGAGVRTVVTSWWGWGSVEDQRLPAVLQAAQARGLRVAIHLEPYAGRTLASIEDDVEHLTTVGIRDFYIYRPTDIPAEGWAALESSLEGVRLFAQTAMVGFAAAGKFDGVYTYDILLYGGDSFGRLCAQARQAGLLCAPSVGPGYLASRATGDTRMKPRRRGATYDAMWSAALRARADFVTITSYNEWNEGTQIEPATSDPIRPGYLTYDGAYGLRGVAAEGAYLKRTARWTHRLASGRR
jgi:glycoprotein endo-alpha-1,2-mannosidase